VYDNFADVSHLGKGYLPALPLRQAGKWKARSAWRCVLAGLATDSPVAFRHAAKNGFANFSTLATLQEI
jgi:hypothetical protein